MSSSPASPANATSGTIPADGTADNAGLPEEFILTPELVEEEAIRGDIVLRGAVVLLATLFGWTHVTSTATLLQVRTGQELARHGWLPPRTDAFFSYTAADRPWINLSWLSDLWLAGVYAVAGAAGLSVLSGLISGATFWLMSRTSVRHAPTWWSSLCAALAVVAVFPLLTAGPTLVTVLGLASTVFLLQRGAETSSRTAWWWLVPTLWLWSNSDPRAYLGLLLVGLYAVGTVVSPSAPGATRPALRPLLIAMVAALVHPFGWEVLRSPVTQIRSLHPLWQEYIGGGPGEYAYLWRPVFAPETTAAPTWHLIAAFVLLGLCAVALLLNRRRLVWGEVFAVLGLNVLGLASGVDCSAIAVVNAVAAGLNGQRWYQASCRQAYSLATGELLWSRGGRAATVLALFAAAYWGLSGWMTGADGRRMGFGFSSQLSAEIDGYRELLGEIGTGEFDDHPFHLTPRQGDLLVWLGRRSFTDSRLATFATPGATDLLVQQRELAAALRSPDEPLESPQAIAAWSRQWRVPLDEYGVTHVVVPLDDAAGYRLWINMASQGMALDSGAVVQFWQPAGVEGPAAVLYRLDSPAGVEASKLAAFLQDRGSGSIVAGTFRQDDDEPRVPRGLFPRPPTFYESSLLLPEPVVPNDSLTARHFATRLGAAQRSLFETVAYCQQVIRHARRGLAENPNSAETYMLLGEAYQGLWTVEGGVATNQLAVAAAERRFVQAVCALQHAAICRPDAAQPHATLVGLYLEHRDFDLALRHLDRLNELTGAYTLTPRDADEFSATQQQAKRVRADLAAHLEQARVKVEQESSGGLEAEVRTALQYGTPGYALELLEEDLTLTVDNPALSQQYARLLLLSGRTSDGLDQAERLLRMVEGTGALASGGAGFRTEVALANLAADLYDRAAEVWEQSGREQLRTVFDSYLVSLPLVTTPGPQGDGWPIFQIMTAGESLGRWIPEWELTRWQIAMNELESGQNRAATKTLEQVLESNPRSLLRPQIALYLTLLTGQAVPSQLPGPEGAETAPSRPADRPPSPSLPIRAESTQSGTP